MENRHRIQVVAPLVLSLALGIFWVCQIPVPSLAHQTLTPTGLPHLSVKSVPQLADVSVASSRNDDFSDVDFAAADQSEWGNVHAGVMYGLVVLVIVLGALELLIGLFLYFDFLSHFD